MTCSRCNRKLTAETSVYSQTLRLHYCAPPKWVSCDRIYNKQKAAK
jgi:hypothetical protein